VLAAALDEAMALLLHGDEVFAVTGRLEVDLRAPAPIGTFVHVAAELEESAERTVRLRASAWSDAGNELAAAHGVFVRVDPGAAGADGG
jgi:acyl-CoA thioesterase FadM